MRKFEPGEWETLVSELCESPKFYQIRGVLGGDIKLEAHYDEYEQWFSLSLVGSSSPHRPELLGYTKVIHVSGDIAVVRHTQLNERLRGRGIYNCLADLRDRLALRCGFGRLISTVRGDNIAMQKAATKNGWRKISSGTVELWLKEIL